MRNSNFCILACCAGVSWAAFASAQPFATGSNDQERALEALRQAEAAPPMITDEAAQREATKRQREQEKLRIKQEKEAKKAAAKQKKEAARETSAAVAQPAPAASANAAVVNDQLRALEALRQAEEGQTVPNQAVPAASAPAVAPAPVVSDQAAQKEAAKRQREQDELVIKQEKEAKKAAAEQARIARAKEEAAAAEQARIAKAKKDAAAAEQARIAKANKEAASPGQPKTEMQKAPPPAHVAAKTASANTNALSAREQKLADLLRRYEADEITPYQYHLERAKIIAEP